IKNNHIIFNNEVVRKELTVSRHIAGSIKISSLYDKVNGKELLTNRTHSSWFEFVINHKLVTSNDLLWKYIDFTQRNLQNKGTEYTLHFKGMSDPVKGLLVSVKEQIFPQSSLIREKLILHTKGKNEFALSKLGNKLHFIFPRYTYTSENFPV